MVIKNKSIICFVVAAFAVFLATFNETFLNVALNNMCVELSVDFATIQWLVTAYMLGAGIMVPISAFMYRKVPTKLLFSFTLICFLLGSVLGALAGSSFILVLIARVIQSIGSGMLIPVAMNIVLEIAPKQKLGSYMGIMGAMTTLGPSLSVIMAGLLLSLGDFHILFWVFGGLCLICFILGLLFVGNIAKLSKPKLDILSVILISLALICILFAISYVFTVWWLALIIFAVGIVALLLFVLRQNRIADPLINLQPLRVKTFSIAVILNMLGLIIVFAFNVLLPQYLQSVLGVDALIASLTLFPAILLSCVFSPLAGRIYDKKGAKWLLAIGFSLMALFAILLAVFISCGNYILVGALYVPVIIGSALVIGPVQSFGLSSLKPEQNPHGVTIFSTGFQIAGCIGASLFASAYSAIANAGENFVTSSNQSFLIVGLIIALLAILGLALSFILYKFNKNKPKNTEKSKNSIQSLCDIMKTEVYTLNSEATILDVMQFFVDKKISGCPIMDNGKFVGFISDGDIIRFLSKNHTDFKNAYTYAISNAIQNEFDFKLKELLSKKVLDVASKEIFFVDVNEDLGDVCKILAETHKKKVPVMQNGEMIGIVTRSDITKYAMKLSIDLINNQNNLLENLENQKIKKA